MKLSTEQIIDKLIERCCDYGSDDHGHTDCWLFGEAAYRLAQLDREIDRLREAIDAEIRMPL